MLSINRRLASRLVATGRWRPLVAPMRLVRSIACHVPVETSAEAVYPPFARYVHACTVPADAQLVFTSGQLGITADGTVPEGAEAQTNVALQNVSTILQAAGAGMENIVRLNAYVSGREHLQGYMRARDAALGPLPPTASTLMIVSGFARPEMVVEVEAIAAINPAAASSTHAASTASVSSAASGRRGMHMQARGARRSVNRVHSRGLHGERVAAAAVDAFVSELRDAGIRVITAEDGNNERREIARRSRDYFWYSPILAPLLKGRVADALILATSEADVVAASTAAVKHGVPLTARGAGTGNYGQAVPLRGGAVLDLSGLDEIEHIDAEAGTVRAGAGAKLGAIEDAARAQGWELRQHPSTRRMASIGGFVAGGSTGHGALLHGGLSEDGAILGLRVVTAEPPTPRVLELRGRDVFPVVHAYGTNGIITAVEIPLARAQPWTDVTAAFPTLAAASAFALDVANAPAVVKRAISVFEAPMAHRFLEADQLMHAADVEWASDTLSKQPDARHVCMVQAAAPSLGPIERLAQEHSGQVTRSLSAEEAPRPFYEFGWNHTTLHALRTDKTVTYIQSVFEPDRALELVDTVAAKFDTSELMQHLEVVAFGGRKGFASLALMWPRGETEADRADRLREMLAWHEANGMPVFDPHTHILEDGGMKQTDWAQLGFKRRVDPSGVLNPGKMRAWEEQSATIETSDPRGAFAASYRLADTSETGGAGGGRAAGEASAQQAAGGSGASTLARPRSRLWSEWSTTDFAEADLSEAVAILPLGATEAHGPHLPLGVDAMHNADLLARVLQRLPESATVLALPPLDVGVSCEHSGFAGTLELSAETAAAAWTDLGASVARTGIRKLVLYNSHGGNHALAEVVSRRLRQKHGMLCVLAMNIACLGSPSADLFPEDEVRYGIHGGALETSLMLHLRPDLVSTAAAADFASRAAKQPKHAQFQLHAPGFGNKMGWLSQDLNPAGVVGAAATLSDADKGAELAEACVQGFTQLLLEVHEANVDELLGTKPLSPPQGGKKTD